MSGNKKIIHFLSASDRLNYGDLLFPIIFKEMLDKNKIEAEFNNYGIVKSDLSHFGAMPTKSYRDFQKNVRKYKGNIIIGGGEVFFANWVTLYSLINPFYAKILKNKIYYKLDKRLKLPKRLLSFRSSESPFVPVKYNSKLFFSSVGGEFSGKKKNNVVIASLLKDADLISVRDKRTQLSLEKYNVNSNLVPDSALLMSDLYSVEYLENKVSSNFKFKNKNYLLVQLGINKGPRDIEKFSKQILEEAGKMNMEIILCPIGMAPNHEDHKLLEKMNDVSIKFKMIIPESIFEIMLLIAKSKMFIGTSLHGIITAQSFNIPFIALNKKIGKTRTYIKTWMPKYQDYNLDFEEIKQMEFLFNKWNPKKIEESTREQKMLIKKNLSSIFSKLI